MDWFFEAHEFLAPNYFTCTNFSLWLLSNRNRFRLGWMIFSTYLYSSLWQAMTEAAFFTIGRSRTIGYGKIRPLADYRSRSRMLIFFLIFLTFILFIDSSSSINSFNQFLTRPCENWTLIILTHLIFQKFNPLGVGSLGD